jgi:hypothetical protein
MPVAVPPAYESKTNCTGDIGPSDPVALVHLKARRADELGPLVLRDYADLAKPRTVCTIGEFEWIQQLIDARHIVIEGCPPEGDCAMAVVDLPEVTYHWFRLPGSRRIYSQFVAISPDLKELVWTSTQSDGDERRVHLTTAAGDRSVARLLPVGGRCGSPDDSRQGDFSPSGKHYYVLDVPIANQTVFLVMAHGDRRFSLRPPQSEWPMGSEPAMAVWGPDGETVYYRRKGDIWRWSEARGAQKFLDGVAWRHPSFTPDGRFLAYSVARPDGLRNVYLMDMDAGTPPKLIGRKQTQPVFLNNQQLWFLSQANESCAEGPNEPEPMIYDVRDGSRAPSIIQRPVAVWPASSSNY